MTHARPQIGRLIEERHRAKIAKLRSTWAAQGTPARLGKTTTLNQRVGQTSVVAGRAVGMGASKYEQASKVVAAAEADPETFGDLPAQMDATGNVSGTAGRPPRRISGVVREHDCGLIVLNQHDQKPAAPATARSEEPGL